MTYNMGAVAAAAAVSNLSRALISVFSLTAGDSRESKWDANSCRRNLRCSLNQSGRRLEEGLFFYY